MRIGIISFLLALLLATSAFAIDSNAPLKDPQLQARYETLTHQLRCLVCQNESIANSTADLAADLRGQVRKMLLEGMSNAEIIDYMTDRYGQFVLYKPPVRPSTWLLWAGPFALLLVGAGGLALVIRRRSRMLPADAAPETEDEDPWA